METKNEIMELKEVQQVLPIANQFAELFGGEIDDKENKRLLINYALALKDVKTKSGTPAINVVKQESVVKCGLDILTKHLDLSKNQVALICYGDTLKLQMEYFGRVALVKSELGIDIHSCVIRKEDEIEIDIDEFGVKHITHKTKWKNFANDITGAYAVAIKDGKVVDSDIMTFKDIYTSWLQSQGGIKDTHKNFREEMCRKTVESRLCKHIYQKSGGKSDISFGDFDEDENIEVPNEERDYIDEPVASFDGVVEEPKVENKPLNPTNYIDPTPNEPQEPQVDSFAGEDPNYVDDGEPNFDIDNSQFDNNVDTPNEPAPTYVQENDIPDVEPTPIEQPNEDRVYVGQECLDGQVGATFKVEYGTWKNELQNSGQFKLLNGTYNPSDKTVKVEKIA